jgi:hypothetical protein
MPIVSEERNPGAVAGLNFDENSMSCADASTNVTTPDHAQNSSFSLEYSTSFN